MKLIYFDESKADNINPCFFIGGILIDYKYLTHIEDSLIKLQHSYFGNNKLTKETELHGENVFQGNGVFRGKEISERIRLFGSIADIAANFEIPIRVTRINVHKHKKQYISPMPEYSLGLMLTMERFCNYLKNENNIGLMFGDEEHKEINSSIERFNHYKIQGKTDLFYGKSIKELKDTIYFSKSHYSRFIQMTDMLLYMASRYEKPFEIKNWHDGKLNGIWNKVKKNTDFLLNAWL